VRREFTQRLGAIDADGLQALQWSVVAVEPGYLDLSLAREIAAHRLAHHAEADEAGVAERRGCRDCIRHVLSPAGFVRKSTGRPVARKDTRARAPNDNGASSR
jgi:hypothetical protein